MSKKIKPRCKVESCSNIAVSQHYCSKHYMQFKRFGVINVLSHQDRSNTPGYNIWRAIRTHQRFNAVCAEWANFETFIIDMGKRPSSNHQLRRIDPTREYTKINCFWDDTSNKKQTIDMLGRVCLVCKLTKYEAHLTDPTLVHCPDPFCGSTIRQFITIREKSKILN